MKFVILAIMSLLAFEGSCFAQDVTTKQLDDVVQEIPGPKGEIMVRTVNKVTGYYRGDRQVLLKYDAKMTTSLNGKKTETDSTAYFVVANDEKIIRLDGKSFTVSFVTSKWPIDFNHVCHVEDGKGTGHSNISIPEIGFYKYLEFKDGELLPLLSEEDYSKMKEVMMKTAETQLKKK